MDDPAVNRLMTITGVNLAVAAGIVAAIGDIGRFNSPQKLVSYFGLNPRVRQSGLGVAHHGRISKVGRSHARAMLVEAAWAAAKAPGPLHAFFVRIRARRGHQIAAVAVARKLTVLCWHLLTKERIITGPARHWSPTSAARCNFKPGIRNRKVTGADQPMPTTSRRCATGRCGLPPGGAKLRTFVSQWKARRPRNRRAGASVRQDKIGNPVTLAADASRSSPRGRPRPTTIIAAEGKCQLGNAVPVPRQHPAVLGPVKAKPCGGRKRGQP